MKPSDTSTPVPPRLRLTVLTWIGVYPVLTLIALIVEPLIGSVVLPVRTLVMSAIMVPVMVYAVMPFIQSRFLR